MKGISNKHIKKALNEVKKSFGNENFFVAGENYDELSITRTSSGSINLDLALGGGYPEGRVIEVFGQESSGKTTLALLACKEFQEKYPDKYAVYIDMEKSLSVELAKKYGVDLDRLIITKPDTGEEALEVMEMFVLSGNAPVIVIDSVSSLVPQEEKDKGMDKQQMGLQARLMSKGLRKLTGPASDNKCTLIFINQIREKIGVMFGKIRKSFSVQTITPSI